MYTEDELNNFRKAGEITSKAREYGKSLIKVGVKVVDVVDAVDNYIIEQGADLAFPAQISIDNIAAHYGCSYQDDLVFTDDMLVKLDLGAKYDGAIGDTAVSVDLTHDKKYEKLIEASREALNSAIKLVKPGTKISQIGAAIENEIKSRGFKPVRNLCGHGIGINSLHGKPSIPNYDTGEDTKLEEGMTFAIEPFASTGSGHVAEKGEAEIFSISGKKPIRSPITKNVFNEINKLSGGMPFVRRHLDEKFGTSRVNYAINDLSKLGILHQYPPLLDTDNGIVSQAEHSVLVTKEGCEILTK